MTFGEKITESRKRKGIKMEALAAAIGKSMPTVSGYENNRNLPDPETVVSIAEALGDESILLFYLENNPVYKAVLPKVFPDLNSIKTDPSIIFNRVANEAEEAMEAAKIMGQIFSNANPRRASDFDETFKAKMEQILDVKRAVEILEFQLLASGIMTKDLHKQIYEAQQEKCIRKGHHDPAKAA